MNTIEVTEEQYAAHLAGESITIVPKPKRWEPSLDVWVECEDRIWANSKQSAKDKRDAVNRYKMLLDYVEEFGGYRVADWGDKNQLKGSIDFNCDENIWVTRKGFLLQPLCQPDMSPECARDLVVKLNSGEVVL